MLRTERVCIISHKVRAIVVAAAILVTMGAVSCDKLSATEEIDKFLPLGDLTPAPQDEQDRARVLQAIIKGLQLTEAMQTSGDVRFQLLERGSAQKYDSHKEAVTSLPQNAGVQFVDREIYIGPTKRKTRWVFNGVRFRYATQRVREPDSPNGLHDNEDTAYDGVSATLYRPEALRASIANITPMRPKEEWLTITTLCGGPLSEFVSKPGVQYEGTQTVGGTECYRLSVSYGSGAYQIWVDPTNGWHARRIADLPNTAAGNRDYNIREIETFKEYEPGRLFPASGRFSRFLQSDGGALEWEYTIEWSVLSYTPTPPESSFEQRFAPGTRVTDLRSDKVVTFTVE